MIGITGFKVALCLAYLRIVPPSKKIFKPIIWMVLVSCVLAHVAGTLVLIFQCSPVYFYITFWAYTLFFFFPLGTELMATRADSEILATGETRSLFTGR